MLALDRMNQLYFHMPNVTTKLQQMIGVVGVDPRGFGGDCLLHSFQLRRAGSFRFGANGLQRESGYLFRDEIRKGSVVWSTILIEDLTYNLLT